VKPPVRILHVGSDSAFVDFLRGYFERAAPGQNELRRYPKAAPGGGVVAMARAATTYALQLARIAGAARRADVVVAHMMSLPSALALLSAPRRAFRVWSGWGADYYGAGTAETEGLLGPRSALMVAELGLDRGPQGGRAVRALTTWTVERAIRATDAFSAPIPDDFEVMRRRHPSFRGTYLQLNYADMASFGGSPAATENGDILLGNSAWVANNHLEALEHISRLDLGGRKVFTPLAYGNPDYRRAVLEHGRRLLGDAFEPLLEPMPFEEYRERVGRCSVVVMNHYRQQGLGNVGMGLYSGAHVYLSRRNPLHAFLRRTGLDVHSLESASSFPATPVTGAALQRRHELMSDIWGEDVVLDNVRRLLEVAGRHARA